MKLGHLVHAVREAADRRPEELRFFDHVRAGRIGRGVRLTCRGKDDGGGAQVHAVISALAFAHATGLGYSHTPFRTIAHGDGAPDWEGRWERFFALGEGEAAVDDARDGLVPLGDFLADPSLWRAADIVVHRSHYQNFCDRFPRAYDPILPALRRKYALAGKSGLPSHRLADGVTIAAHLRRGDVHETHADRFTGDSVILRTIEGAIAACGALGRSHRVNLYSEGEPAAFAAFVEAGCQLHLDEDVFATIDNLVRADILIMAKSSFSYVPALLGDRVKLYEPFRHPPLAGWIARDARGDFDRDALIRALEARRP